MTKLTTLAFPALLASNLVACIGDDNAPPAKQQPPVAFPRTCAEAARGLLSPVDGEYVLFVGGNDQKPWSAFCADMSSDMPTEYLTLPTGASFTSSMYRAGGRAVGTDVVTQFDKVRIDPLTLRIDGNDTRFATSTGSLTHVDGSTITEMPLGVAMSCGGGYATAMVNISGTPFILSSSAFVKAGDTGHAGNADLWQDENVVEIWADGDCGWVGPAAQDPTSAASQPVLQLTYL